MSKSMAKSEIPEIVLRKMEETGNNLKVGDLVYIHDHWYAVVTKLYYKENYVDNYKYRADATYIGPHSYNTDFGILDDNHYSKVDLLPGESHQDAMERLDKEAIHALEHPEDLDIPESEDDDTTSIIPTQGKSNYVAAKNAIKARKRKVDILAGIVKNKVSALQSIASQLSSKIHRIQKVIDVLELYLGLREAIVQIQDGDPAPENTPISIRQLVLYLDEEVGIYEDGGIDFQRINEFDDWITKDNHIDILLPEKKGIVACKPARHDKHYSDDVFANVMMNVANKMLYLLIRNGDKLYRIYTDTCVGDTFIPTKKDVAHIEELFKEAEEWGGSSYHNDKLQDAQMMFVRNALIIQGIIDRTMLLQPLPDNHINMMDPKVYEYGNIIRMIRDAEDLLPSGRKSYEKWKTDINSKVKRGSRIYYVHEHANSNDRGYHFVYYSSWYPSYPESGVYIVDDILERQYLSSGAKFKYMPDDYYGDRKNRVSFVESLRSWNILNYDAISLEDVEFYIHSRVDRPNYLRMLPVLMEIKKIRLQEIEDEKKFVALLAHKMHVDEKIVWKYVDWWKYKNIWKRPIKQDDAKAWRMINGKIKAWKSAHKVRRQV